MTTLAAPPPPPVAATSPPAAVPPASGLVPPAAAAEEVVLDGISWETYERVRDETVAAGQVVYITYDEGRMTLVSPLPEHERWKSVLGRMVGVMSLELRIPICSLGSTTWKRRDRGKGLEADECYYVQNERVVRGKKAFDLTKDPPPDLAFESERTRWAGGKLGVYAGLGVPEVWRYDGKRLTAVMLQDDPDGRLAYVATPTSRAFPFLTLADLEPFLARTFDPEVDETTLLLEFRDWVVATLKPKA